VAPQKSPAFQFYAKDFQTGTATMSLQEVGAYIRLLAHQWDSGSVPAEPKERARILGCAKAQEVTLWKVIGKKFDLHAGVYLNERLETERKKQTDYRRRQSDNGKASAASKANQRSNDGSTVVATVVATVVKPSPQPLGQPNVNSPVSGLRSSRASSKNDEAAAPPLIKNAVYVERRKVHCAFVGSKLEVPNALHADLRTAHGGDDPEKALQAWYLDVNERAEIENWSIPAGNEIFKWLKTLHDHQFPATMPNGAKSIDAQIDEWARS
jgi:uncharacterized protein YdaU (DUF1376 family)